MSLTTKQAKEVKTLHTRLAKLHDELAGAYEHEVAPSVQNAKRELEASGVQAALQVAEIYGNEGVPQPSTAPPQNAAGGN